MDALWFAYRTGPHARYVACIAASGSTHYNIWLEMQVEAKKTALLWL